MIVTEQDIKEVEHFLDELHLSHENYEFDDCTPEPVFFADRPHLLMPLGYDEFRAVAVDVKKHKPLTNIKDLPEDTGYDLMFPYELFYRTIDSGAWHWFEGITHYKKESEKTIERKGEYYFDFIGPKEEHSYTLVVTLLEKLRKIAAHPDPTPHILLPPSLWTPRIQLAQSISITNVVPNILNEIQAQEKSLRDISWRQLEELVAELLRSNGLEVFITQQTHDGGRDVIAKGELIPGEPAVIAIEVKQKDVVGLHDVQRALQANADFPALLIATAGRFSAGVIREKQRHRNQLRLFLKDGIALTQWIDNYRLKVRNKL
ncbi:MAG: restriction system protein [Acidobacteriota bacterium]|jgi:HJR/Mrr/RecB family endonuclease|nr:restriction system protein [Acidobacteriota bacterium]